MMKIAIVIPVYNRREITINCLNQLTKKVSINRPVVIETIVVDDGSTDGTAEAIRKHFPEITILTGDGDLWWTGAVNKGVKYALTKNYDGILLLNDDLIFEKNFLVEIINITRQYPDALVSSIKLLDNNTKYQIIAAGFRVYGILKEIERLYADLPYLPESMGDIIECDILTGSSLFIPTKVFEKIGIFDSIRFPHHWGDFEFTRRASLANFKCLVAVKSKIYGEYNQNYATPFLLRSTKIEYIKSIFNNTTYYHGFLSLYRASFMLKNKAIGTILYLRCLLGLLKSVFLKIVLSKKRLTDIYKSKI